MNAHDVFEGSDGALTRQYYAELEKRGPRGLVALNLFRAQKTSSRAKKYRGGIRGVGRYKDMAYERKQWSMKLLSEILKEHGEALGIQWGWKTDPAADFHTWVMYIDIPQQGQVSFHSPTRGVGPEYPGNWDGKRESQPRILEFCDQVIHAQVWFCACGWSGYSREMNSNSSGGTVCPRCGGSGGLETKRVKHPDQMELLA